MLAFLTYYKQQSKVVYRKDKLSWPLANRLFLRKPAKTRFSGESKANFTTPCSETKWAIQNSYEVFYSKWKNVVDVDHQPMLLLQMYNLIKYGKQW